MLTPSVIPENPGEHHNSRLAPTPHPHTAINIKGDYSKYSLVLENVLSSHLILFLDGFRQREKGLYFRKRNLTLGFHLSGGIEHTQNVRLNWGQTVLGV